MYKYIYYEWYELIYSYYNLILNIDRKKNQLTSIFYFFISTIALNFFLIQYIYNINLL